MPSATNVPSVVPAPSAARRRKRRRTCAPRYLTQAADGGWRFQIRVPASLVAADSTLAGPPPIIRAHLGPHVIRSAERIARRLAAVCQAAFAAAAATRARVVSSVKLDGDEMNVVRTVVEACQAGIQRALAEPSEALAFAQALSTALSTLQLVQTETSRGDRGAPYVIANSETLTRSALDDVLRYSSDPAAAKEALSRAPAVAPGPEQADSAKNGEKPVAKRDSGVLPTFAQVSRMYIDMRVAAGAGRSEIKTLELRRRTFIELIGDRRVDEYYPSDLQNYVTQMKLWPGHAAQRKDLAGMSVREIIDANRSLAVKPLRLKSMTDGYVTNIRTMMRHGMADYKYHDPFGGVRIRWPEVFLPSMPREDISVDVTNEVFRRGVAAGRLVDAILPLLAFLTGRRLGLMLYLRGSDFRLKDGVPIAQTTGIVFDEGTWKRVPIKTGESLTFFALHELLQQIGFFDWARAQPGWIFAEAHEHPDPSRWASKVMNSLLKRCGAAGDNIEVFHCFRGDAIDRLRDNELPTRTARLQVGHELSGDHEKYGHRALRAGARQLVATMALPEGVDFSVFERLDFDALAAARTRDRRRRKLTRP